MHANAGCPALEAADNSTAGAHSVIRGEHVKAFVQMVVRCSILHVITGSAAVVKLCTCIDCSLLSFEYTFLGY